MHEEAAGHCPELGCLVLVRGLCFHLPQVSTSSLGFFLCRAGWLEVISTLTLRSPNVIPPRQHHIVLGSFIVSSLIQLTHLSVIRSNAAMNDNADRGLCLEIPALVQPSTPGKLPNDRKFKEATESGGRPGGEETGTKHSCSFSPSAARLKHAVLAAKRKVTGSLRTGNLITTKASSDTSNLMFSSSFDSAPDAYSPGRHYVPYLCWTGRELGKLDSLFTHETSICLRVESI